MDIGQAVASLRGGKGVYRSGWNDKNIWLKLQQPDTDEGSKMTLPYVYMQTTDGQLVPWQCSHSDLLAEDWEIA